MNMPSEILLIEDDRALRMMLRGLLEIQDFKVWEADRRETGLQLLKKHPNIRIVILDFGLPPHAHTISEGLAMLTAIQSQIMTAKVIVLTGQDHEAASLAAIREGAFDFLAKPASSESILRAVTRATLYLKKENELSLQGITRIAVNAQVGDGLKSVRDDAEERLVRQILKETRFNVYQSARRLGVKRENIYYFMKKYGIEREAGSEKEPEQDLEPDVEPDAAHNRLQDAGRDA